MTNRGIQRNIRRRMSRYQKYKPVHLVRLGDGNGTVQVPGRNNAVYVRSVDHDLPSIVTNYNVPNADGLQVYVGQQNGRLVVTGPASIDGWDPAYNPTIGPHAQNHTYGGPDVVYSSTKQIIELSVVPAGGLSVKVYGGVVATATGFIQVLPVTLDLTASVPVSNMRFALVAVTLSTGAVAAQNGSTFALESYSLTQIPAPAAGTLALAAVRLVAGQTVITNLYADPDIIDLRFSAGSSSSATTSRTITTVTNTYTVLAGDDIVICNKATAFTVTLPAASGSGKEYTIKSIGLGTVTVDGNSSDTIDGETTQALDQYDSITIVDRAANVWSIL